VSYQPTWDSVSSHPVPTWYEDAKLGVFLHWGLFSVPGWAPRVPDINTVLRSHRPSWMLANIPYAEWYPNTMRINGSPTARHHAQTYGASFPYDGFRPMFEEASKDADLAGLADLCRRAGARYVVLTTKHGEGYCLWPTDTPHPVKGEYHSPRDLVGDLAAAVRAEGIRMGLYYSGGYDWPYNDAVLSSLATLLLAAPSGAGYARYVESHVNELIDRYHPSVLWNDIAWPAESDLPALFARYYDTVDDGVVNDRWYQGGRRSPLTDAVLRAVATAFEAAWPVVPARFKRVIMFRGPHADFLTPEYETFEHAVKKKWEATRGVGHSFGANRNEAPEDILTTAELVHLLVDVVAKNGNLLIGVGPAPDGRVPEMQAEPLLGLGRWLEVHGEAVYDTRPWLLAGASAGGSEVRFTTRTGEHSALYATVLGPPAPGPFRVPGVRVVSPASGPAVEVTVLGAPGVAGRVLDGGAVEVTFPAESAAQPAHVVRLSPAWCCRVDAEPAARAKRNPGAVAPGPSEDETPTDVTRER
jgi:alpha-L-fucosidase